MNAVSLEKTEKLGLVLYIVMGWAVIFVIKDIALDLFACFSHLYHLVRSLEPSFHQFSLQNIISIINYNTFEPSSQ